MGRMGGAPTVNGTANTILVKPLSAQKAQKLDMASVERRGKPNMAREIPRPHRMFGLQEAPTFRPSEEEFRNPIEYMRSIAEEGKKYGIVKIIPPDSWNPDFAINTEVSDGFTGSVYLDLVVDILSSAFTFAHAGRS